MTPETKKEVMIKYDRLIKNYAKTTKRLNSIGMALQRTTPAHIPDNADDLIANMMFGMIKMNKEIQRTLNSINTNEVQYDT